MTRASSSRRAWLACTAIGASVALGGCYREYTLVDPPGRDAGPRADASVPSPVDAGPPDAGWREPIGACTAPAPVDLLFVIDSSATMAAAQASLVAQLPRLVSELLDPPDSDGDGAPDWPAIPDLQVGVITTDMGSAGHPLPTCGGGAFGYELGDDGLLLDRGDPAMPGCDATYPSVFRFTGGDRDELVTELGCMVSVGTGGCGFEQPLEAALKALSPSTAAPYTRADYVPPTFFRGTVGHGGGANRGLVRESSMLAVVIVTDEDDCSVRDPELTDPSSSSRYSSTDLNLRCFSFPDAVHPVQRYVDGLLALRAHRPDLFALAVIAGIPVDAAVDRPTAADFEAILAHAAMIERVDPSLPTRLVPSCNEPGRGVAFPPRRLVQVAAGVGEGRSTVQSICQEDLSPAVAALASLFVRRACQGYELLRADLVVGSGT